ncbi:MAG: barstar family protein [Ruminiclostridium sp.]|nr:barstar family protein [Ruminiclostridium sp.]
MSIKHIVHLDLTGCEYVGEVHQRIKTAFGFPDYYGENWHAFRDAFITVGLPEKIVIHGENSLPAALMETVAEMHRTLDEIKQEVDGYGWLFTYEVTEE